MKRTKKHNKKNTTHNNSFYTPGRNVFGDKAETHLVVLKRETAFEQMMDCICQLDGSTKEFTFDMRCFDGHKEELDQIAELDIPAQDYLRNDAGKVYGYKFRNNVIYKSIKILVDGSDYTGSFSAPVIETIDSGSKKYSRVMLSPTEVLPCPDDTGPGYPAKAGPWIPALRSIRNSFPPKRTARYSAQ